MPSLARALSFSFRLALAALLPIGLLSACAGPRLEVANAPAQPSVVLEEAGLRLILAPHAWNGYPGDLARYYSPVQVRIENDRPDEIQVRYSDFLIVDDAQNQYRAVPPDEVARALYGLRQPTALPAYASAGPWWPPYPYWSPFDYPFSSPLYPYSYFPGNPYWYGRGRAYDILTLGLREGPLLPGARVSGFLYFQLATRTAQSLTLSWAPHDANGKPLATFRTQFQVVR